MDFTLIEFAHNTDVESFKERLKYELIRIKNLDEDTTIDVASRKQFLDVFDAILLGVQMFVSAIAAISLIVGGIGIMNIMLVTVKERTKEIGLRKAVGTKNKSVLFQFLIEAILLTSIGGLFGIVVGLGISYGSVIVLNTLQPNWGVEFVVVPSSIAIACLVSIVTGIIFGLYPAWKAARLQPTEALRYE